MHHDLAILEQVCYHKFKPPNILCMCSFVALPPFKSQAFGKDPMESDIQETINSDTESEEEKPEQSDQEDDTPKARNKEGIVH